MLQIKLQRAFDQLVPNRVQICQVRQISGGCISHAFQVRATLAVGDEVDFFVKSNHQQFVDNYRCEWNGLTAIERTGTIRVPRLIASGIVEDEAWLILEWVKRGKKTSNFFESFGRQLATMHLTTRGHEIGWEQDNYLGASLQRNQAKQNWPDFFASQRITMQIRMASDQYDLPQSFLSQLEKIASAMGSVLQGSEPETSLIHGDLWSGNFLSDEEGKPVLIDPAVYRGNREAEFGMLRLFGNCPALFYDSYHESFPLPDGWENRCNVYVLYHLLNHLNLFGPSYLDDCKRMCSTILSER